MKINTSIPPIYYECQKYFGVNWDNGIAIAYGDTVYAKYPLGMGVESHEMVHLTQQRDWGDPKAWWHKYLTDKHFRLSQEVPAYQAQVRYITENVRNRDERARRFHALAYDLSSAMYGNMCTFAEAKKFINGK